MKMIWEFLVGQTFLSAMAEADKNVCPTQMRFAVQMKMI
jgi:hypothetical protein